MNVVISGGTGSGKTTLLNVLSSFIPDDERIVTIEDAAELQLPQEHVVALESRPPNIEGEGAITIRDLVRNALRMRPDRIVVGECRGGEALDMLQAMNTGHDGSLTTVHANTPRDALSRLETLALMAGLDLPSRAIRDQIASAVNLIVQQSRLQDGSRRITHITEVTGQEGDVFTHRRHLPLPADRPRAGRQGPRPVRADRATCRRSSIRWRAAASRCRARSSCIRRPEPCCCSTSSLGRDAAGASCSSRSQHGRASCGLVASPHPHSTRTWMSQRVRQHVPGDARPERAQQSDHAGRSLGGFVLGLLLGDGLLGRLVATAILGLAGYFGPRLVVKWLRKRRLDAIDNQLVDTLHADVERLKAGLSLQQALELVAREMKPPIADEFGRLVKEIHLGRLTDDALRRFARAGAARGRAASPSSRSSRCARRAAI